MPTITEGLADIKILTKRIEKKRQHILGFIARPEAMRDPLQPQGGSVEMIRREQQAVHDLEERIVEIRRLISHANNQSTITIRGETRSIFDWLTWRKEVAQATTRYLTTMRTQIDTIRRNAQQRGAKTVSALAVNVNQDLKPEDVLVNVDEDALAKQIEDHEAKLGVLDGQLSLKNATIQIDYQVPEDEAVNPGR